MYCLFGDNEVGRLIGSVSPEICPQLVFIPLNFAKYSAKADEIRAILVGYDARFEAASVDEAFLNITKVCARPGARAPRS